MPHNTNNLPVELFHDNFSKMLPPRRAWRRGNRESRHNLSAEEITINSIMREISAALAEGRLETETWGKNLLEFHNCLQRMVAQGNFTFEPPMLHLIRKNQGRIATKTDEAEKCESYRCLATFAKLNDRVIIGKTAMYLRDAFDPLLLNCCYAFRRDGRAFSFHSAVRQLIEYRIKFKDRTLYVADCDIQKFFDSINHQIVLTTYDDFVRRFAEHAGNGETIDGRARKVLEAYLAVYSFPRNLEDCKDVEIAGRRNFVERLPENVLSELYAHEDIAEMQLGLPQGGALSPLLANLVLDAVDKAVLDGADNNLFYARFCDDTIIIHPQKQKCEEALERYLAAVKKLLLPVHKLVKSPKYTSDLFKLKSKGPIAWKPTAPGFRGSPWVSFLGHQIRYDGEVRIRKETIEKHKERLQSERTFLKRMLKKAKGKFRAGYEWKDLFDAFELRIIAMGVGKVGHDMESRESRSWLSIFKDMIKANFRPVEVQMKNLDRTCAKVLAQTRRMLKGACKDGDNAAAQTMESIEPSMEQKDPTDNNHKNSVDRKPFLGAPFSYYGSMHDFHRQHYWKRNGNCKERGDGFNGYGDL